MRSRKLLSLALAGLVVAGLAACDEEVPTEVEQQQVTALFGQGGNGNGAPSGPHFNLNLIGVEKGHENDNPNSKGHRIFVPLGKNGRSHCDINLWPGSKFEVLDYNCLDSDGDADFRLPDPDPGVNDGVLVYSVWARALGKPGGSADMSACYTDAYGDWCWAAGLQLDLNRGNKGFYDASRELLTVCACTRYEEGVCVAWKDEALFSDTYDYFWHYENDGLRLAQLRFYPIGTYTAENVYPTSCRQLHGADIY